jgi:hypothetical protein
MLAFVKVFAVSLSALFSFAIFASSDFVSNDAEMLGFNGTDFVPDLIGPIIDQAGKSSGVTYLAEQKNLKVEAKIEEVTGKGVFLVFYIRDLMVGWNKTFTFQLDISIKFQFIDDGLCALRSAEDVNISLNLRTQIPYAQDAVLSEIKSFMAKNPTVVKKFFNQVILNIDVDGLDIMDDYGINCKSLLSAMSHEESL